LWAEWDDEQAAEAFRVCPSRSFYVDWTTDANQKAKIRENLVGFLQRKLSDIAELNYPYAVNFTGLVLPPHPVDHTCAAYEVNVAYL